MWTMMSASDVAVMTSPRADVSWCKFVAWRHVRKVLSAWRHVKKFVDVWKHVERVRR